MKKIVAVLLIFAGLFALYKYKTHLTKLTPSNIMKQTEYNNVANNFLHQTLNHNKKTIDWEGMKDTITKPNKKDFQYLF